MTYYSKFNEDVRTAANNWLIENYHQDLYLLVCKDARRRPPNRSTREALAGKKHPEAFNEAATDLLGDVASEAYRLDLALRYKAPVDPNEPSGERYLPVDQATFTGTPAQAVATIAAAAHANRADFGLYLAGGIVKRILSAIAYDSFENVKTSEYAPETITEESYYRDEDGNIHHTTTTRKTASILRETPASLLSANGKDKEHAFDFLANAADEDNAPHHYLPVHHKIPEDTIKAAEILSAFEGSNSKANRHLRTLGIKGDAKTLVAQALELIEQNRE